MGTNKAIVVGAGIGGLTAARALQSIGWRVALYEQAPLIGPVGAGLAIAPNAVKALDHLGLRAALRERGLRQDGLEIRLRAGRRVAAFQPPVSSDDTAPPSPRCTVPRCTACS